MKQKSIYFKENNYDLYEYVKNICDKDRVSFNQAMIKIIDSHKNSYGY